MELRFTYHARLRLAELSSFGVTREDVLRVIETPDVRHPEAVTAGVVDAIVRGLPLRVVYTERAEYYLVISVHRIREERL